MPRYSYTAVDLENKPVKAEADAKDDTDLRRILKNQNMVLTKYKEVEQPYSKYRLKADEVGEFSRQLASMLSSGISVVRAIDILKNRDFKKELLAVYDKLHKDVQQGYTLSEAFRLQPNAFPELFVNMYASAEASGQLEQVASKMATQYEKEHRLNSKVKSAMTYPIVLLVVTVIVVMVIFALVLPQFFTLFEGMELPALTRGVIAVSGFLQSYWYIVLIAVLCVIAVFQGLLRIRTVALWFDTLRLRVPIVGKLLKIIYTARFARTLSSLYSSGVPMITALEITSTIVGNKFIEDQFVEVIKNVRNGEPLSEAIGAVKGFDSKLSASIMIGEESGRLDSLLTATAESFDYEAEAATNRLVQLLEPLMIVIMAVVVGIIMLSVMQPLMGVYQNIG